MTPRHAILAVLLAAALAAAFWPQPEEDGLVEAVVRPAQPARAGRAPAAVPETAADAGAAQAVAGAEAAPRFADGEAADLFPAQSFRPPPRPVAPVKAPPPPPPMAPPLPFAFVGAWSENGQASVFLSKGDQVITAQAGASLPGGWRLDMVGADALTFTYVSLNQQRTLRIAP